jgi:hypothetical protein
MWKNPYSAKPMELEPGDKSLCVFSDRNCRGALGASQGNAKLLHHSHDDLHAICRKKSVVNVVISQVL